MSKTVKLIISIIICFVAGGLGTIFTTQAIPTWYAGLVKPPFSPPNYLFGPVWSTLYLLMGISLFLVWSKAKKDKNVKFALKMFAVQLFLNAIWSPIFFGAKNLGLAFIVIVFMWIFIVKTIQAFSKVNKLASRLLWPYLAWVSFASVLNFSVWMLNK